MKGGAGSGRSPTLRLRGAVISPAFHDEGISTCKCRQKEFLTPSRATNFMNVCADVLSGGVEGKDYYPHWMN